MRLSNETIKRKHLVLMLNWCIEKWGKSKFERKRPKIKINNTVPEYGSYHHGVLSVNIFKHIEKRLSVADICATVIHEYTHYLQDMDMYNEYTEIYGKSYEVHPYEITANNRGNKWKYECKQYLLENS